MAKRVQLIRGDTVTEDAFTGLDGEITVDTTKHTLRVHDNVTAGGHETALTDASNIQAASSTQDGKMLQTHVQQQEANTVQIATNKSNIATNVSNIATNASGISANTTTLGTKADKVTSATAGHIATLDASGNLVDSGLPFFDTGTVMVFYQASVPTGFTQKITINDQVLRVVSGSGGGTGGNWTLSGMSVDSHTLSTAEIPAHNHSGTTSNNGAHTHTAFGNVSVTSATAFNEYSPQTGYYGGTVTTSSAGSHNHSFTTDGGNVSGGGHTHGLTNTSWRPAYIDVVAGARG